MRTVDVLIIGAGPTGIGSAYRCQQIDADWLLVESGTGPGGMAASVTDGSGFTWDLGGHVLHSHFSTFDKAVAESGVPLLFPERNGWIWTNSQLVPTPIQHQVEELPTDIRPHAPASHLAEYYQNQFGTKLTAEFFRPFQEKMWATPLETVDHTWTSLRNGSTERNVPSIRLRQDQAVEQRDTFPYPAGGTGALWAAIAANFDQHRLQYGVSLTRLDADKHIAHFSNGDRVRYSRCVSSMPLPALLRVAGSPNAKRAENLIANQVFVVGLGFEGDPPETLADKSWLYSPDRDIAWHRATMLSNYDQANAGEGRWSVLFEVGRSQFRQVQDHKALADCCAALHSLGADLDRLVSTWTRTVAMGYPVPTLGRDALLAEIDTELTSKHIRSRGRFGGWRYESCNQDYSFMQGIEAIDAFHEATPENVYWHPEDFS